MSLPKRPDELFSRHWFHIWNEPQSWRSPTMERIDSLRKRLEGLELRLRKFGASPNGRSKPISQSDELHRFSALSTAGWLGTYIGVWQLEAELPLSIEERSVFRMLYPYNTQIMDSWDEKVMGKPNWDDSKKCCLIMLSDEGVDWLNEIVHWLEKNEGALV